MRVCVYGAGAIGGHLAVRLAKGGAEVSVIARGKHLAAIQANGLEVHAVDGVHKIKVQATDDPRTVGPVDAVFVTVKAPALPAVAAAIGPLLKQDTAVPFVMNGIPWWFFLHLGGPHEGRKLPRIDPDDVLLKAVGPDRAVGGVVYSASAVIDPGVIEVEQPKSRVVLGEPNGTLSPRVVALAELITKGGISGEATTEIRTEIWNKLIGNLAGGTLAVLSGMAPKSVYTEPAARDAALRVMHEAAAIAQGLGARPGTNHEGRVKTQSGMDHKPSILQDLELGRPMEIDGLFDAPLVLARIAGVETPTLDLLVALCKLRAALRAFMGADDMEMRIYGRTGMNISILGFGCGAVGGLMVRGAAADQERAVGRALDVGINYFDTAVQYGNGASETNLGRTMKVLKPAHAFVGTKVRLPAEDFGRIAEAVTESLDGSLARLQMDHVDIFHLHNAITVNGGGDTLSAAQVLNEVVPAFEALRKAGKTRFLGITAVGDTEALLRVIDAETFDSAQVSYNMLNPSAGEALPAGYPAQDYGRMFDHTQKARVGVVGIRVIAGGALSGSEQRHPIASPPPAPIGTANSYEADVARARRLMPLVTEGFAASLPEAATRFAVTHPAMGTILVGMATVDEFEGALAAVQKGPLPAAALARLAELRAGFSGETR